MKNRLHLGCTAGDIGDLDAELDRPQASVPGSPGRRSSLPTWLRTTATSCCPISRTTSSARAAERPRQGRIRRRSSLRTPAPGRAAGDRTRRLRGATPGWPLRSGRRACRAPCSIRRRRGSRGGCWVRSGSNQGSSTWSKSVAGMSAGPSRSAATASSCRLVASRSRPARASRPRPGGQPLASGPVEPKSSTARRPSERRRKLPG